MSRPGTDRLKFNKPLGTLPVLQYLLPEQLLIDPQYQRTLDSDASQALVCGIAQHWNYDLCQPLVVARRADGKLYVIDGQHRLAAAKLRGDIPQLPAQVLHYANVQDEAASFVLLNQQRKPLTRLDLFKAAVASGDTTANAIVDAMREAGLSIAPHSNYTAWKPGMVSNIGGIEACWRGRGGAVTAMALRALAEGFKGQVLQYAGTIFPGIAAVIDLEARQGQIHGPVGEIEEEVWDLIIDLLGSKTQDGWRREIMHERAVDPNLKFAKASAVALLNAWERMMEDICGEGPAPAPAPVDEPAGSGAGADDSDDGDEDPEDSEALDREMARQWEDVPDPGDLAETVAAPAAKPLRAPAPVSRPAPAPAPSAPKTAPTIDWGKLGAAAKGQVPASVAKAGAKPFKADGEGKCWCTQCDSRVTRGKVNGCRDRFCDFGGRA